MRHGERTLVQNIASIERVGALEITDRGTEHTLQVPLQILEEQDPSQLGSIHVFEDGVVHEDVAYAIGFELLGTYPIRRAALCINDSNELWMTQSYYEIYLGGMRAWRYAFQLDDSQGGVATRLPFAFTCGFSRVEVRLEFFDGPDVHLCTPDIVSLDEPQSEQRGGGPVSEREEEKNVRSMFLLLTKAEDNQAAEWMFARGTTRLLNERMSFDEDTDWAYASISMRLQVASDALHCVHDGLEDPSDAFPLSCSVATMPPDANPRDVEENRAVRALIVSIQEQVRQTRDVLHEMLDESSQLYDALNSLISRQSASRHRPQSLPAMAIVSRHVVREEQLCFFADDLHWRVAEALTFLDDPVDGFGQVGEVPFHVPDRTGVFQSDKTYSQLREAMRMWEICVREPPERMDLSLHAIKPDKLFEYSALHKMLSWLWDNGFVEDVTVQEPIGRFWYDLQAWYNKYQNEVRCANTYHLVRPAGAGEEFATHVHLYYQPVLYLNGYEENGIDVHRVSCSGADEDGEFWTPDYLLEVCQGDEVRAYLMDAKYCSRHVLESKLDECVDKYVARSARGSTVAGTGIDGVVLLAGKMDAPALDVSHARMGDSSFLRMIAPFNMRCGKDKLTEFFCALGIDALGFVKRG